MGVRILIVEDEAIIAEEIKSTLEGLGHKVTGIIMNGDKVINILPSLKIDLVILDINIKGNTSGIDLARVIRKNYNIPFIFLTAFSDENTLAEVRDTYPYGYIVKPFNEADLKVNVDLAMHKFYSEQPDINEKKEYIENKHNLILSDREYELLIAFREGLSYQEAADKLFISINTVKSYQKRLYQLFEVNTKVDLIRKIS